MSQHLTATQATRKKRFSDELRFVIGAVVLVALGLTFILIVIRPLVQAHDLAMQEATVAEQQMLGVGGGQPIEVVASDITWRYTVPVLRLGGHQVIEVTYLAPDGSLQILQLPLSKTNIVIAESGATTMSYVLADWTPQQPNPLQYNFSAHLVSATVTLTQAQYNVLAAD